jgi:colanic acid/amylovoran biosynthesis glycosyltransferase
LLAKPSREARRDLFGLIRDSALNIAYLVNRYPAPSHSFIRREILSVEAAGASVLRFSIRATEAGELPDPRDVAEHGITRVILSMGIFRLLLSLVGAAMRSPRRLVAAACIAFRHSSLRPVELVRSVAYLAEAAWLARELREARVQHLHAHFGTNPAMVARLAHRLGGPPFSFTVHGPDEFDQPQKLDLHGKIADAAFCTAISSFGRSQLMRWSDPDDWPKIELVRCGLDADYIEQATTPVPSQLRLCSVARLSAQKGIPLLIQAAAKLKEENVDFQLVIVGGGELRAEVERMIAFHKLQGTVQLTGWANSDGVRHELIEARAMVLPSFAEGLPVVIMESLALGRPVIVSAIAGTPELVDASCGWLVPAGSTNALVEAMKAALAASPDQLASMGVTGRHRVAAMHDARKNGAQLLTLITRHHGIER